MPSAPSLTPVTGHITTKQRLLGATFAAVWSRAETPPVSADRAGVYAAALAANVGGEARERIARCLVWCDCASGSYVLERFAWYLQAFAAFPEDERCAFFVAALCQSGVGDEVVRREAYARLLRPDWSESAYWSRLKLLRAKIVGELARLYADEEDGATDKARVAVAEEALTQAEKPSEKRLLAGFLCRAYRDAHRKDEAAEVVYRYIFNIEPDDAVNGFFLARLYNEQNNNDTHARTVYARAVELAEAADNGADAEAWAVRLARAHLALGQADEGTIAIYRRAVQASPGDEDLFAAYLCASARRAIQDPKAIRLFEKALTRESELAPRFARHGWEWGAVPRALALLYGREPRTDDEAVALYAQAAAAMPRDTGVWMLYAHALAEREDTSETALVVYERTGPEGRADEAIGYALAKAYVANHAHTGIRRADAQALWELLFRQGQADEDMIYALSRAYTGEERANDIALMLWERQIAKEPENGPLRLRLAQESRARSDWETAKKYYEEAAPLLPKNFTAQYEAGIILSSHFSDDAGAIRLLKRAVKLPEGNKHLDAHFALGEALMRRELREEAKTIFAKIAGELNPQHAPTLIHLARLNLRYEEEGAKQAEALYEQAKRLNPDEPETYRRMADLYRERGQMAEEEEALEKFLTLSEPDAQRYRHLADLYIRRGDFHRAEDALRQVVALGQADKRLYVLLGEVISQKRPLT